jgi:hypothetical protein
VDPGLYPQLLKYPLTRVLLEPIIFEAQTPRLLHLFGSGENTWLGGLPICEVLSIQQPDCHDHGTTADPTQTRQIRPDFAAIITFPPEHLMSGCNLLPIHTSLRCGRTGSVRPTFRPVGILFAETSGAPFWALF